MRELFHGDSRFNRNRRPFALQSTRDSISIVGFDVSRCVMADFGHAVLPASEILNAS